MKRSTTPESRSWEPLNWSTTQVTGTFILSSGKCGGHYEIGDNSRFGLRHWRSCQPLRPVPQTATVEGDMGQKSSVIETGMAGVATLGLVGLSFAAVYWLHAQWILGLTNLVSGLGGP